MPIKFKYATPFSIHQIDKNEMAGASHVWCTIITDELKWALQLIREKWKNGRNLSRKKAS